jgi:iron(III) transport system permease protein
MSHEADDAAPRPTGASRRRGAVRPTLAASWLTGLLAWLPALVTLALPVWLLLRVIEAPDKAARLVDPASEAVWSLLGRSLGLALAVAVVCVALALPLAWLTVRSDLPGRRLFSALLALPLALPSYVGAFALLAAFGPRGLLATTLGVTDAPDLRGFAGAVIVLTLLGFPYVLLPLQSAMRQLDPRLEESARTLGATPLTAFRRVSLPLLWPSILSGALMVTLYVLSDFGAVSMLQVNTFTRVIYMQHDTFNRPGAAALGLILLALTAVMLVVSARLGRRELRLSGRRAVAPGEAPLVRLGPLRWLAVLPVLLVVLASVGAPVAVVVGWATVAGNTCTACSPLGSLALNTLTVSVLTAAAAMVIVLPVARWATRGPSRLRALPDRILYAGFAIPGVVLALAFVFLGTRLFPGLYQTLPLLVVACVLRFLPQAADTLGPALARVPPALEEAAATLGATRSRRFGQIALPLVRSAWLTGGALVFLTTLKELPATLVMRPSGWDTLATELWDLTNEGYHGEAAWRALWILALGVLPMLVILARTARSPHSSPPRSSDEART